MPVAHLLETRLVQRPELEGDLSDFPIVCRSQVTAQFRPTAPWDLQGLLVFWRTETIVFNLSDGGGALHHMWHEKAPRLVFSPVVVEALYSKVNTHSRVRLFLSCDDFVLISECRLNLYCCRFHLTSIYTVCYIQTSIIFYEIIRCLKHLCPLRTTSTFHKLREKIKSIHDIKYKHYFVIERQIETL